jgi:sugar phosphate permease
MPLALLGSVSAEWAPLSSSGIFLSILSCNLQIGPVITMPLAGQLCSSPNWGWPPVYYILGTLSLLFFLSFFCFFRDSPRQHRWARADICGRDICGFCGIFKLLYWHLWIILNKIIITGFFRM